MAGKQNQPRYTEASPSNLLITCSVKFPRVFSLESVISTIVGIRQALSRAISNFPSPGAECRTYNEAAVCCVSASFDAAPPLVSPLYF